jgi:energy-coupling factor transporter ATP-binding protein EcfA2
VLGPSGSGKSTLARVMVGIWPEVAGEVLLDGLPIASWSRIELGPHLGYLPQDIELFEGTIAENIARFGEVDSDKVIEAARSAGLHEMILRFPKGYDTPIGEAGNLLSGGQRQRIGLARAVYGDPVLVVLDEPNANLDDVGEPHWCARCRTSRRQGRTVLLITHRPGIHRGGRPHADPARRRRCMPRARAMRCIAGAAPAAAPPRLAGRWELPSLFEQPLFHRIHFFAKPSSIMANTIYQAVSARSQSPSAITATRGKRCARQPHGAPGRIGWWALAIGFGGSCCGPALAPLDEGVPGQGMVSIDTKRKAVQHLTGGIVKEVLVTEGSRGDRGAIAGPPGRRCGASANYESVRQRYLGLRAMQARLLGRAGQPDSHQLSP